MGTDRVVVQQMRAQGWTDAELAKAMGESRQLVYQLTRRTWRPEEPMLSRLALVLRLPVSELVDDNRRWRVASVTVTESDTDDMEVPTGVQGVKP